MDFRDYVLRPDIGPSELRSISERVRSWRDLQAWLDEHPLPPSQPPIRRTSLAPQPFQPSLKAAIWRRLVHGRGRSFSTRSWQRVVLYRQRAALALTFAATAAILYLSCLVMIGQRIPATIIVIYLPIYGLMTLVLTSSFFKMMLGSWYAMRSAHGNPWHPAHRACNPEHTSRTAIIFPVLHEDMPRVAAGMAATWSSLQKQCPAVAASFDVFLLSDSRQLASRIAEEAAIHELRRAFPDGRFFYRWRSLNRNAKCGNIADFCRRWGSAYEYMLVMDADSLMEGETIHSLLRMMEGDSQIGILQTNPVPVMRKSLFGRMQQFAARLYGATFSYSLQSMYMGHGCYIGHNAMVRVRPFARHCLLPYLSGAAPWGGKPLSHDIVESALMARAGYEVWFLPEVKGSYEEIPANAVSYLMRERRWMQGNLQHLRLLFIPGLRSIHRETFLTGSMGYVAAPLWAAFLVLSAYGLLRFLGMGLKAMGGIQILAVPMLMLFLSSVVFLFMPRAFSLAIHFKSSTAAGFGGKDKLAWSLILETLFSLLFSPIQMIAVSRFIWMWLRKRAVSWGAQLRDDAPLKWRTCLRAFGWISLCGMGALLLIVGQIQQLPETTNSLIRTFSGGRLEANDLILWLSPVLLGLTLSPLIAKATSHAFAQLDCRRLFATPEEIEPPLLLRELRGWERYFRSCLPDQSSLSACSDYAFADIPFYLAHRSGTRYLPRQSSLLLPKILDGAALSEGELSGALKERHCFDALHRISREKLAMRTSGGKA